MMKQKPFLLDPNTGIPMDPDHDTPWGNHIGWGAAYVKEAAYPWRIQTVLVY